MSIKIKFWVQELLVSHFIYLFHLIMLLIWNVVRFLSFLYSILFYVPPLIFLFCGNRQHSQNYTNNYTHLPISSVPTPIHKYSHQFLIDSSCVYFCSNGQTYVYFISPLFYKNVACYNCSFTHCFFPFNNISWCFSILIHR